MRCEILARSEESRRRAWAVFQQFRAILEAFVGTPMPEPARRTFYDEGRILTRALVDALLRLHGRERALVRLLEETKGYLANPRGDARYPHLVQELNRALQAPTLGQEELHALGAALRERLQRLGDPED